MLTSAIEDPRPSPSSSIYVDAPEHQLVTPNDDRANQGNHADAAPAATELATANTTAPLDTNVKPETPSGVLHASPVADVGEPTASEIAGSLISGAEAKIKGNNNSNDYTTLTPLRAHYLKKSLVTAQFSKELLAFTELDPRFPTLSPLSYLGQPFTPAPKGAPPLDVPFLKFMFRQFVLTFPFIAAAPKDFFPSKLQPFVGSLVSRNLSTTDDVLGMDDPEDAEDPETRSRLKIIAKAEKYFSFVVGSALKLTEPEEVVRLSQRDLDRLEILARKRAARLQKMRNAFDVNIVCVRTVVEKGRVRSRIHEEFIIRTRREGWNDVLVSRRYGDFKTLAEELRKMYPDYEIKGPPPKDRTALVVPPHHLNSAPSAASSAAPFHPRDTLVRSDTADSAEDFKPGPSGSSVNASSLAREKNRVSLRSYLHGLLSSAVVAHSPVLRSFLLSGPTELSPEEVEDSKMREEADHMREEGRKKFASEVAARVDGLRTAVRSVKGDIMGKNGLTNIFSTVKVTPLAKDLPPNYQAVLEWGRITLASTIFQTFVASDDASGTLAALKRFHGLMPYFVLKGILKISNPMAMIRGLMDLFMAQPFGGRSLLQRYVKCDRTFCALELKSFSMFTSSLFEESKALQEDIAAVADKVGDPALCGKIRQFVYAPKEIQAFYRSEASMENISLLMVILRSSDAPLLNRAQMHRVIRAGKAHSEYMKYRETLHDSDDDDGPENDDAWLFEDLNILAKLYSRLRDKEQLIDLIFEGTTSELLKDIFAIFYAPLAQVYKAANISDSLGDLQNFITDLIRTIESCEALSQEDPHQTVQIFINLVERHEQAFYSFVHKVQNKGEGLFDSLMHWIELFLTLIRDGFREQFSLEFILPHTGPEREQIMKEVDDVALYYYKMKLFYEEKLRRRFGRVHAKSDADADDAAAQELVEGVVKELSFGELVKGDANDIAAEESESSSESEDEEEEEEGEEESSSGSGTTSSATNTMSRPTPGPSPPPPDSREQPPVLDVKAAPKAPEPRNKPMYTHTAHGTPAQTPPPTRPRLRPSKSFSDSSSATPTLVGVGSPAAPARASLDKSLPPMPRSAGNNQSGNSRNQAAFPPRQGQTQPPSGTNAVKKRKKMGHMSAEPPELTHIPKLLPLFLEMIRPSLRPRAIN
ncbi:hypothetical protein FRC17_006444 [Serendipita sp. 399]|nr:hypothetical protein FRC17_006444 [Serendipita sp. 399]